MALPYIRSSSFRVVSLAAFAGAALVSVAVAHQPVSDPSAKAPAASQPADAPAAPSAHRAEGRDSDAPANVEAAMKLMRRSLRQLRAQITDSAKRDENLKLIGDMERGCLSAKSMPVPDRHEKEAEGSRGSDHGSSGDGTKPNEAPKAQSANTPSSDWAKTEEMYRGDLISLMRQLLDVEQDLAARKFDQAKADLDKVIATRKDAHKELNVKDKD
jgi:hypothetical protein